MRLFEIASEFNALQYIMENDVEFDEETGEVIDTSKTIESLFNEISLTLNVKLDNSTYLVDELMGVSKMLKEESNRLNARADNFKKNADKLKDLMRYAVETSGEKKIQTDLHTFSFRKSETVEFDDIITPDDMPRQFVRIKREFDKAKIKEALKNGEEITGAKIVTKQNFQIK